MVLYYSSAILPFHEKPNAQIMVFLIFISWKEDKLFDNGYAIPSSDLEKVVEG